MSILDKAKILNFNQMGDSRGHLVIVEGGKDIPFIPKRVFYIYGSNNDVVRGCHANKNSEFVLINVSGRSKIRLIDDDCKFKLVSLDRPHMGIYIPRLVWKEMFDFSSDSVLLCLASTNYDPNEYIRNFDKYQEYISSVRSNDGSTFC